MTFLQMADERSYVDEIMTEADKFTAKAMLKKLDEFCNLKYDGRTKEEILDELHSLKNKPEFKKYLYALMKGFIKHLDSSLRIVTTRAYFKHFKRYLKSSGFEFSQEDLKDNGVKLGRVIDGEHHTLIIEELEKLFKIIPNKHLALYHVLTSSGIRIKECVQLRKRDFDEKTERIKITIPGKYAKNGKQRITFCSKESEQYLRPKLRNLKQDDLVFTKNPNAHRARQNEEERFDRIRNNAGFTKRFDTGHHEITIHSFRAWFVTRCNRIDYGFGHSLAGHDQYMARYDRLTESELLELYIKAEPTLQIFDRVEDQTQELQSLREEIKKDRDRIEQLESIKGTVGESNKILDNMGKEKYDKFRTIFTKALDEALKK